MRVHSGYVSYPIYPCESESESEAEIKDELKAENVRTLNARMVKLCCCPSRKISGAL